MGGIAEGVKISARAVGSRRPSCLAAGGISSGSSDRQRLKTAGVKLQHKKYFHRGSSL